MIKKKAVDTGDIKMVKAQHYCSDNVEISKKKDDLFECADEVAKEKDCAAGKHVFFHRKSDNFCGCCTKETAIDDASPTFDLDLNMYQRDTKEALCSPANCKTCAEGNSNECAECDEGYKLSFGTCFNFIF